MSQVGYVLTLGVASAARRRGVAAQLLQRVLQALEVRGCRGCFLHVVTYNARAIAFYLARGFAQGPRLPGFYVIRWAPGSCSSTRLVLQPCMPASCTACRGSAASWSSAVGRSADAAARPLLPRTGKTPEPDRTVYDAFLFHAPLNADVELPFSTYVSALFSPLVYARLSAFPLRVACSRGLSTPWAAWWAAEAIAHCL